MVGARLTKIGDLTLKMLGTANRPEVAFKGAETKWCLFYAQDLLKSDRIVSRRCTGRFGGKLCNLYANISAS